MKKIKFEEAELQVIKFDKNDVIATSGDAGDQQVIDEE